MTNGIFKRLGKLAYARAADVMSTQSTTGFEWSVKLLGNSSFRVGIATQFKGDEMDLHLYDENAIFYCSSSFTISIGKNKIHSNLPEHKDGDVVRFRFQPHAKKLIIDLVRTRKPP